MQHGKTHECVAREAFITQQELSGKTVHVRMCGVVLHQSFRFLGASPDSLVCDKSAANPYGLLEIKCPYAACCKLLTVEQACTDTDLCCELVDGRPKLRRNHAYYFQIQGQMAICRADWCDFFLWLGTSPFLERVNFDSNFWCSTLLPALVNFYHTSAIPYLKQKGRPFPNTDKQSSRRLNCYEELLSSKLCQSRIDGRNSSSACTVICTVFV